MSLKRVILLEQMIKDLRHALYVNARWAKYVGNRANCTGNPCMCVSAKMARCDAYLAEQLLGEEIHYP